MRNEYEIKIEKELNSGVINNEIFMTFSFGDTENLVTEIFRKLKNDGKLFINDKRNYSFTFVFDEYEFNNGYATFSQKYHNDKLYEFRLMVFPHDDMKSLGGSGSAEFLQTKSEVLLYNLAMLFMEKYGVPIEINNAILDSKDFYWVSGNREIKISMGNNFVNIFYTDLKAINQIEQKKKNKMLNSADDTKDNI